MKLTSKERRLLKQLNFSVMYGMGVNQMAKRKQRTVQLKRPCYKIVKRERSNAWVAYSSYGRSRAVSSKWEAKMLNPSKTAPRVYIAEIRLTKEGKWQEWAANVNGIDSYTRGAKRTKQAKEQSGYLWSDDKDLLFEAMKDCAERALGNIPQGKRPWFRIIEKTRKVTVAEEVNESEAVPLKNLRTLTKFEKFAKARQGK